MIYRTAKRGFKCLQTRLRKSSGHLDSLFVISLRKIPLCCDWICSTYIMWFLSNKILEKKSSFLVKQLEKWKTTAAALDPYFQVTSTKCIPPAWSFHAPFPEVPGDTIFKSLCPSDQWNVVCHGYFTCGHLIFREHEFLTGYQRDMSKASNF